MNIKAAILHRSACKEIGGYLQLSTLTQIIIFPIVKKVHTTIYNFVFLR